MLAVGVLGGISCVSNLPTDEEDVASQAYRLETDGSMEKVKESSPPSSSSPSSLTMEWDLDEGVTVDTTSSVLRLVVRNHEEDPIEGHVSLDIIGLNAKRTVDLGAHVVAAHDTISLTWAPASSPIAPIGTVARVTARVRFTRNDVTPTIPADRLFIAFSSDEQQVFVSSKDGNAVQLASLGLWTTGKNSAIPSASDRGAMVTALGVRKGKLDGKPIDETSADVARRALTLDGDDSKKEALVSGPTISVETKPALDEETNVVAKPSGPVPLTTCPAGTPPAVTVPICVEWAPDGFLDLNVYSSSVPYEDIDPSMQPAAYAQTTIYDGSTQVWSGRLDANGCSSAVTICPSLASMSVSSYSIQRPSQFNGTTFTPASREYRISPSYSHQAMLFFASTSTGTLARAEVRPSTDSSERAVRVASIVSRILTMADNGVATAMQADFLPVHTENGCMYQGTCSHGFTYDGGPTGGPYCGEACADDTVVWFGPSLRKLPNGGYEPTGVHTTSSAYIIAHELGHSAQYTAEGNPVSDQYIDTPDSGRCSCDHVSNGNRVHCLQSRHPHRTANIEGFGHHYATRVMNERGTDARFTYYKTYRNVTWTQLPFGWFAFDTAPTAPPIPVRAGGPYVSPAYPSKPGWVNTFCGQASHSSEYDWMTFLWAVNGTATSSTRSSMEDLFAIFGNPAIKTTFTSTQIASSATARLGAGSAKSTHFSTKFISNGLNL